MVNIVSVSLSTEYAKFKAIGFVAFSRDISGRPVKASLRYHSESHYQKQIALYFVYQLLKTEHYIFVKFIKKSSNKNQLICKNNNFKEKSRTCQVMNWPFVFVSYSKALSIGTHQRKMQQSTHN